MNETFRRAPAKKITTPYEQIPKDYVTTDILLKGYKKLTGCGNFTDKQIINSIRKLRDAIPKIDRSIWSRK